MRWIFFCAITFLFLNTKLQGLVVGNPSDPALYSNGLFSCGCKKYSLKAGFLYNNVYKGRFKEKFAALESTPSDIKYHLLAGEITLNFFNRLDIYSILGTTNLQIDDMIHTDRHFAWSVGLKAILFKIKCFDFSFDGKYFQTNQRPKFLISDKITYPLVSSFIEKLQEYQASLALSYRTSLLIPYIGATFLYSTITPSTRVGTILLPDGDKTFFQTSESITRNMWGMVVGISVINRKKQATLNLESRLFDQNAFAFVATIRF